jgi:hypothetical protein
VPARSGVGADLGLIEPEAAFPGLEVFLDGPPAAGDPDQGAEAGKPARRDVAVEERQVSGRVAEVTADQQGVAGAGARQPCPGVVPVAFGALAARCGHPRPGGHRAGRCIGADLAARGAP